MAGLFISRGGQNGLPAVDWKHPLASGLLWMPGDTPTAPFDLVTGDRAAYGTAAVAGPGRFGNGIVTTDGQLGTLPGWSSTVNRRPTVEASLIWIGLPVVVGNWGGFLAMTWTSFGEAGGSGAPYFTLGIQRYAADAAIRVAIARDTVNFDTTSTTAVTLALSRPQLVSARYNRGAFRCDRMYLDGAREWDWSEATTTATTLQYPSTPGDLRLVRQEGTPGITGTTYSAYVYGRYVTDAELQSLATEPFAMLTR